MISTNTTRLGDYKPTDREIDAYLFCLKKGYNISIRPIKEKDLWQLVIWWDGLEVTVPTCYPPVEIWKAFFGKHIEYLKQEGLGK